MTVVLELTWWGVVEFGMWTFAAFFGSFMLWRCYRALRSYQYEKERLGRNRK